MKTKNTFTVIFFTRKSRNNPQRLSIYVRVTINGKRAEISLKRIIPYKDWDSNKSRGRGSSLKVRTLNAYLDEVYSRLLECHKELLQEDQVISSDAIKARYLGEDCNSKTLRELIAYHNGNMVYVLKRGRLQRVKDCFVFSCYTGLSYVDVKELTEGNIVQGIDGRYWIYTKRQKTDERVKVPLLPKALEIIEKYRGIQEREGMNRLLPISSNQKVNKYLKEIAEMCNISKNITFHVARHTFATTVMLSNGVPIETVSKLLGHSKLTTTQLYARVVETKISEDISNLLDRFKIRGERLKTKS